MNCSTGIQRHRQVLGLEEHPMRHTMLEFRVKIPSGRAHWFKCLPNTLLTVPVLVLPVALHQALAPEAL